MNDLLPMRIVIGATDMPSAATVSGVSEAEESTAMPTLLVGLLALMTKSCKKLPDALVSRCRLSEFVAPPARFERAT